MDSAYAQIERCYRQHARQVLATLIRLLGDFSLAEEALQDAFAAALQQWPDQGLPDDPVAWLITAGHRKGIDQIRRQQTRRRNSEHLLLSAEELTAATALDAHAIADDQLRLLFTCCHPSLALDARVALTLREMCGLTTEQVAHALLIKPSSLAQRIVRAKRKIRQAGIPYQIPDTDALPERLPGVLQVIYLVFNEGYSASAGDQLTDVDLATNALQLNSELLSLLPQGDVFGLHALMCLQHSRRHARLDNAGDLVRLADQDRRRWDRDEIARGMDCLTHALALSPTGYYTLQACIAAEHAQADGAEKTDWPRIVRLYDALLRHQASPVIALNRAVAVAMCEGPQAGLALLAELSAQPALVEYHLFHAAVAELQSQAGDRPAAIRAYQQALALARQAPEQRFLQRQLNALQNAG
ncbi:RNA polymerase sigma factor [Halopseudomonas salegens]|uniref:RNA polymerase, sigma subunit, ECF family n=1 Tax=Halopseudomonas salegens TaxID=1434072 RepID=A0A1H2FAE7_9GAMM|nr:sigma-70 family RNA polymerase sigma factor [Halopseudomonas salegens]SDU04376.1 RNA polymerase, sigma subunit, ECF family [Halopseudomonas salegens]